MASYAKDQPVELRSESLFTQLEMHKLGEVPKQDVGHGFKSVDGESQFFLNFVSPQEKLGGNASAPK